MVAEDGRRTATLENWENVFVNLTTRWKYTQHNQLFKVETAQNNSAPPEALSTFIVAAENEALSLLHVLVGFYVILTLVHFSNVSVLAARWSIWFALWIL